MLPRHVLVVTREFRPQGTALEAADFEAVWQVLQAAPEPGALAFYNSGPAAGASQPHRHFQAVPLPIVAGFPPGPPLHPASACDWDNAADGVVLPLRGFPFKSWAAKLPAGGASDAAFAAYESLCAVAGVFGAREEPSGQPTIAIDYNLLCTRDYLQLIPRSWEKVDDFACNALGFAGTFLARSEETLALIRRRTPSGVLLAVGFPWTDDRV